MTPIRVAILGAGFIAAFRAQVYARAEGVEVVSVLSRTEAGAAAFVSQTGVRHVATDWEGLLAGPGFDAVDLCLPNDLHEEFALKAVAAGKHILCEKPLGRTAAEAQRMWDAAERAGIVHAYGENMLHAPDFREILDIVAAGTVGKVLWVRGKEAHFGPHSPWFWQRGRAGGGALVDMGCHLIGVFNAMLAERPEAVLAHVATLHHETDCEDASICLLRYPGGTMGQCEANWIQRGGMQVVLEESGSEGFLTYDRSPITQPIKVFSRNATTRYFSEKVENDRGWLFPTVDEYRRYGYEDQIRAFLRCIRHGEAPAYSFREGWAVNHVMDAAYASAREGRWQDIRW
jgi:predicted dehydrogenase